MSSLHNDSTSSQGVPTQVENIAIENLLLDPLNPRLPDESHSLSQTELAQQIVLSFDAYEVAKSIAEHGYFHSEPLIAIPDKDNKYTVVEGNRRLTSLKVLKDPNLLSDAQGQRKWKALSQLAALPDTVPVLIAESRSQVAPIIGFRHISGIQPWDPFAKARFIARLVDESQSIDETAKMVGETASSTGNHFRNFKWVEAAKDHLGVNTSRVEDSFGVFTRAMNEPRIRAFTGTSTPSQVMNGAAVIDPSQTENAEEFLSWIFGDDSQASVISDSRDISTLAAVVDSDSGLLTLRNTRNLSEAFAASEGPLNQLIGDIQSAIQSTRKAKGRIATFRADPTVNNLVGQLATEATALKQELEDD